MKCMINDLADLCSVPQNDEEYARRLRRNMRYMGLLILLGLIAAALGVSNEIFQFVEGQDMMSGFYTGLGVACVGIGIVRIISVRRLLKNPKKLHQTRIENYDERKLEISRHAVTTAFVIFAVILLTAMMIVGFFERTIFWCCWAGFMLLAVILAAVLKYYEKKM